MPVVSGLLILLAGAAACQTGEPPERAAPPAPAPTTALAAHPLVDATHAQLFGAVADGHWIPADSAVHFVEGGEVYRLYALQEALGTGTGRAPAPPAETCENSTVRIEGPPAAARDVIAVGGDWDALPRVPALQDPGQPLYREAVGAWLRAHGIPEPEVQIDQLLRIDLDGDGTYEVLITASRLGGLGTSAAEGDYAFVLLRQVADEAVRTLPVVEEYYPDGCIATCAPAAYRVVAVLDVDGDGVMEIIVGSRSYEGEGKAVYDVEGDRVLERLSWSCGV